MKSSVFNLIASLSAFLCFLLFTGVFRDEMTIMQSIFMAFFCLLYAIMPVLLCKYTIRGVDMSDKRNSLLLAITGLFGLFALSNAVHYGIFSIQMLMCIIVVAATTYFVINIIRAEPLKVSTG